MIGVPLGAFHLSGRIGKGGMGEVWHGLHTRQQVPVAVKFLREDSQKLREAFTEEVRAVARLDHPGVILVLDHGVVDAGTAAASEGRLHVGSPWLAMEFCSGGTLAQRPPTSWSELRSLLVDILAALAYSHARAVLHRDLTPENVMFAGEDDVRPGLKLSDFGLAFAFEPEAGSSVITGTPAYMAPEQFARAWRDTGPWTDLYALGCVAWGLATGVPPFGSSRPPEVLMLAHRELDPPTFKPRFTVPDRFEDWLRRLLDKDPGRRPPRAAEAAAALLNLDGARAPGGMIPVAWRAAERPRIPMRLVGAGLGLYGVRAVPMVGRATERDELWTALREVQEQWSARVVTLHGAAGVGKTRLAEWLCERAHESGGATILRADHSPERGDGIGPMLARHLACTGLDRAETRARLETLLAISGDADEPEGLTELMHPSGSGSLRLGAPDERHVLVRRLLERRCAERPVIVHIEDAHWAGETLGLVEHVLRAQTDSPCPILFVLTVRDEELSERPVESAQLGELMSLPTCRWSEVRPLSGSEQATLVHTHLGLDGDLAERLRERAGGNPAFAVQLVGDWVQRGILEVGNDGFSLRPGAHAVLPDDIHAVWTARVDRVLEAFRDSGAEEARISLEIAAVLGAEVDDAEWHRTCELADVTVAPGLVERLVRERLVRPVPGDGLVWAFAQGMLRESLERAAEESGRLADHHRAAAAMVRDKKGARGVTERLGRHLFAAGKWVDALGYLLEGARLRAMRGEYRAAHTLLSRREDAVARANLPETDERRAGTFVVRADVYRRQGQFDAARREAERVVGDARRHGWKRPLPDALAILGELARLRGEPTAALEMFLQARTLYGSDQRGTGICLIGLADLAAGLGELGRAGERYAEAHATFLRLNDSRMVADCLRGRADVARRAGALPAATELVREAIPIYTALGHRAGLAESLVVLAGIDRARGDLDAATAGYRRALKVFESIGSGQVILPLLDLGLVLNARERWADAVRVLHVARKLIEKQGRRGLLASVHAMILPGAAALRDWSAFDQSLTTATPILQHGDVVDVDVAAALQRAGKMAVGAGELARAKRVLELARAQWDAAGRAEKVAEVVGLLRGLGR